MLNGLSLLDRYSCDFQVCFKDFKTNKIVLFTQKINLL